MKPLGKAKGAGCKVCDVCVPGLKPDDCGGPYSMTGTWPQDELKRYVAEREKAQAREHVTTWG